MLRRACHDAKAWPDNLFLSINLAPGQLSDPCCRNSFSAFCRKAIFPPSGSKIEITETALVKNLEQVKTVISSLRNLGARVAG